MKMKNIIYIRLTAFLLLFAVLFSCKDLTDLNENPNGVDPGSANANLLLSTVTTEIPKLYLTLGFGDMAGVVQHTQVDAWFTSHNDYDWNNIDWTDYYNLLVDVQSVYDLSQEDGWEFQRGVALVLKSFMFGQIADLWGDAPYSQALQGDGDYETPVYDEQENIYLGIIEDLKTANSLLSQDASAYSNIYADADEIYNGDPAQWRKFANSLLLRYYMRISNKIDVKASFADIVSNNPIFESVADDATLAYLGNTGGNSWPCATINDSSGSAYRRIRPCATLVEQMRSTADPRISVWFEKVAIPTVLSTEVADNTEIDGIRYLNPNNYDLDYICTNSDYVGLPPGLSQPSAYNNNPTPGQTSYNNYVSYLSKMYQEGSGDLLKARLMSYSEVCFLLAEAAHKGWISGEQQYYEAGVKASLETWGVGDDYDAFIAQPGVAYDGTLKQLMTQKWVASWTAAQEAWYDWRRTGYPEFVAGSGSLRTVLPLRFPYGTDELDFNSTNCEDALSRFKMTNYSQGEENSPWSKPWLLQDTDKPY